MKDRANTFIWKTVGNTRLTFLICSLSIGLHKFALRERKLRFKVKLTTTATTTTTTSSSSTTTTNTNKQTNKQANRQSILKDLPLSLRVLNMQPSAYHFGVTFSALKCAVITYLI